MFGTILHTISYIVARCNIRNHISLSAGFLQIGYEFLKTILESNSVPKVLSIYTPYFIGELARMFLKSPQNLAMK